MDHRKMYNADFALIESIFWGGRFLGAALLKLCDFREVEIADFHRGHHHFKRFFAGGAHDRAHHFDVAQHFENGLIEAEIAHGGGNAAIFDEKEPIAGHAGHDFFVGINFADIPEPSDEEAAIGGRDHFFERRISAE